MIKNCSFQREESENKLRELQDFVDTKMKVQILLHDRMVIRYHKMMDKCKNYDKNFERMQTEYYRLKLITQCLMCKAAELFGCSSIEKRLINDGYNNDILFLEVSYT